LVIDQKGQYLYASDSKLGLIGRVKLSEALNSVQNKPKKSISGPKGETLKVGARPRTIDLSPDGLSLYASLHGDSALVRVDTNLWRVVDRVPVSAFPVGLGVSPDGSYVAITSQGSLVKGSDSSGFTGGNSVEFFKLVSD
jgi:DNA-binding beta-propeller fold protein YncE